MMLGKNKNFTIECRKTIVKIPQQYPIYVINKTTLLMALFSSVLRFSFQHDTFIAPTSKTSL